MSVKDRTMSKEGRGSIERRKQYLVMKKGGEIQAFKPSKRKIRPSEGRRWGNLTCVVDLIRPCHC